SYNYHVGQAPSQLQPNFLHALSFALAAPSPLFSIVTRAPARARAPTRTTIEHEHEHEHEHERPHPTPSPPPFGTLVATTRMVLRLRGGSHGPDDVQAANR